MRIENLTKLEADTRNEMIAAEIEVDTCKASIDEYKYGCQSLSITIADKMAMLLREGSNETIQQQQDIEEDEATLQMCKDHLSFYKEKVLPFAKRDCAAKKKAFGALWKEKNRGELDVRNYIEHEIF